VYSSDLKRAFHTAAPIAAARGLSVVADPAFREIDQGEWEGLEVDEIGRRWPDLWGPARHYSARPGGESPEQVRTRALDGIRHIVRAHPHGTVVVVSHGGTIRWLSAEALGYDDRRSARIRGLGNGAAVRIEAELDGDRVRFVDFERLDGNTPDLDDPND
jgi:glucosyl-3-phosphoglycerate phosphatase